MIDREIAPIGEWYVAFYDGEQPHWWWRLCRPGFRHVVAFAYDAEQSVWLLYDVTLKQTHLRALSSAQMDAWVDALPASRTLLAFKVRDASRPAFRFGFWCTPAVAHLVGVRTRALRPQALCRDLLAQGARPAFESQPNEKP
ncbi:hypothetical protein [Brevundimonas sp.]|uniref:hypothetical protein n=1 Tax=Brevundimonas sp. TaxID=1871086 RepID=UPI0025BF1E5B|nr:hypothetical protein [Brevundimonas sp.]